MTDENDQASLNTQVALLRQDFSHMGSDIAEMKQDFKEFRQFYATKEELAYFKAEWKTSSNVLSNQLRTWRSFVISVAVVVVAAIVLAVLKLPLGL
jgi:anti-sigma-K factor RskA